MLDIEIISSVNLLLGIEKNEMFVSNLAIRKTDAVHKFLLFSLLLKYTAPNNISPESNQ